MRGHASAAVITFVMAFVLQCPPTVAAAGAPAVFASRAATLHDEMRTQWLLQVFWTREMARHRLAGNRSAAEIAELQVRAAVTATCSLIEPWHTGPALDNLRRALDVYLDRLRRYTDFAIAKDAKQMKLARQALLDQATAIARLLETQNPMLRGSSVGGALSARASYQMTQIRLLIGGYHEEEAAAWTLLRQNAHALADALSLALMQQHASDFMPELREAVSAAR